MKIDYDLIKMFVTIVKGKRERQLRFFGSGAVEHTVAETRIRALHLHS